MASNITPGSDFYVGTCAVALLLVCVSICVAVLFGPETPISAPHPELEFIRHASSTSESGASLLYWVAVGSAQVFAFLAFWALLVLGRRSQAKRSRLLIWVSLISLLQTFAWVGVLVSHLMAVEFGVRVFLGFALPTAILVYSQLLTTAAFIVAFFKCYSDEVGFEDDEERLRAALIAEGAC